jgi:predicted DNA-binding transcriptional regulator AlpA
MQDDKQERSASGGASTGDLLDLQRFSSEYGFPEATLYGWRHRGIGPRSVRLGRRVYYRRQDIERWIEEEAVRQDRRSTR